MMICLPVVMHPAPLLYYLHIDNLMKPDSHCHRWLQVTEAEEASDKLGPANNAEHLCHSIMSYHDI